MGTIKKTTLPKLPRVEKPKPIKKGPIDPGVEKSVTTAPTDPPNPYPLKGPLKNQK